MKKMKLMLFVALILINNLLVDTFEYESNFSVNQRVLEDFEDFDSTAVDENFSNLLVFQPEGKSFWSIASYVSSFVANIDIKRVPGAQLATNNDKCSYLLLNNSITYTVIKTKAPITFPRMNECEVKLPFSSVFARGISFANKSICIAVSKKDFGIGFDILDPIQCMADRDQCALTIKGASVSLDGNLNNNGPFPVKVPTFFDGMRYHTIDPKGHFAMFFRLQMPSYNKYGVSQLQKFGDYKINVNVNVDKMIGKFYTIQNSYLISANSIKIDLFRKKVHLISLRRTTSAHGLLRDSRTAQLQKCYPSGFFFNLKHDVPGKGIDDFFAMLGSGILKGLIGIGFATLTGQADAGIYLNFRDANNFFNGFFVRGNIELELFWLFPVNAYFEMQAIKSAELKRKLQSWQDSSCGIYELTPANKLLLRLYKKYEFSEYDSLVEYSDQVWKRFLFNDLFNDLSTEYFVMYQDIYGAIRLPLFKTFILKIGQSVITLSPNPRKPHLDTYYEMTFYADLMHFLDVEVTQITDDEETNWIVITTVGLWAVDLRVLGSSQWLNPNGFGMIITTKKKIIQWSVYPTAKLILRALESIRKALKAVAETLKLMWKKIKEDVKKAIDKARKFFDENCPDCPWLFTEALKVVYTLLAIIWSTLKTCFFAIFGKKKVTEYKIGETDFGCAIFRRDTKKCVFGACMIINSEPFVDQVCMDNFSRRTRETEEMIKLAEMKEEIVEVNMAGNLGYQYIIERMEAGDEFLTEDDIDIGEIMVKYKVDDNDVGIQRKVKMRGDDDDGNDEDNSFYENFQNNFESFFKPINGSKPDMFEPPDMDQDLSVVTEIKINATRLSSLFRGLGNPKMELSIPIHIDLKDENLEEVMGDFFEELVDEDGPLMDAIIGDNIGITDELRDAFAMQPPIVFLKNPRNPTIYCDHESIDRHYGENERELIQGLETLLTPLTIDTVWKSCRSDITYRNDPHCFEDEEICGATKCVFQRYIYDGCGQASNTVNETVRVLPRAPVFEEFPDNIFVSCDESIDPGMAAKSKLKLPEVYPGCRNMEYDIIYNDTTVGEQCNQIIYRKWRAQILGCENTLYTSRTQKVYVEDFIAPHFSSFPADKEVGFFEAYGTNQEIDTPKVYDSCGHGPSVAEYRDKIVNLSSGVRKVERTWTAVDKCGNKRNKTQSIILKNKANAYPFSNFLSLSFSNLSASDSIIGGRLAAKNAIVLKDSMVGQDLGGKLSLNDFTVLSGNHLEMQNSLINGLAISLNNQYVNILGVAYDFDQVKLVANQVSDTLMNKMQRMNAGPSRISCLDDVVLETNDEVILPIPNYISASCVISQQKEFNFINFAQTATDTGVIALKGNELIYNVFNLNDGAALLNGKTIRIDSADFSFTIINVLDDKPLNLSDIKIEFLNKNVDSTSLIFNFKTSNRIVLLADIKQFDGSILAPNAEIVHAKTNKQLLFNGQLIAKNLMLNNLHQNNSLFEAMQCK